MPLSITVPFSFRARHWLPVRTDVHEHGFALSVSLTGEIDPAMGFIVDLYRVRGVVQPLLDELHGAVLNGHPAFQRATGRGRLAGDFPTCELLACYFAERLAGPLEALRSGVRLVRVEVRLLDLTPDDAIEQGIAVLDLPA